jgi:Na+:H+ antiporter, NhaA family
MNKILTRRVGQSHRTQRGTVMESQDSKTDLYGGLALGAATLVALILANSPVASQYEELLQATGEIRIGSLALSKTLEHWVNDGLMAVFFLLMGLEIKRAVLEGELASLKGAVLPAIAAFGGFAVPALIYGTINWNNASALSGWAIPCATDIAFVLGISAVLDRAIAPALKTFLLALAIIDDLLAIIVIAIFYTDKLSAIALALAAVGVLGLVILNRYDVRSPAAYVVLGVFTWVAVLKSGVHATLAGVAVGFAIPMTRHDGESLLEHTEHALKPWVAYAIVPAFALDNANVPLQGLSFSSLTGSIPLGIIVGLFFGKQLGVFLFSLGAILAGAGELPGRTTFAQLYGASILTGIGFTMSLFVGTLAFDDEALLVQVRLGVLIASLLSGIAAVTILSLVNRSGAVVPSPAAE